MDASVFNAQLPSSGGEIATGGTTSRTDGPQLPLRTTLKLALVATVTMAGHLAKVAVCFLLALAVYVSAFFSVFAWLCLLCLETRLLLMTADALRSAVEAPSLLAGVESIGADSGREKDTKTGGKERKEQPPNGEIKIVQPPKAAVSAPLPRPQATPQDVASATTTTSRPTPLISRGSTVQPAVPVENKPTSAPGRRKAIPPHLLKLLVAKPKVETSAEDSNTGSEKKNDATSSSIAKATDNTVAVQRQTTPVKRSFAPLTNIVRSQTDAAADNSHPELIKLKAAPSDNITAAKQAEQPCLHLDLLGLDFDSHTSPDISHPEQKQPLSTKSSAPHLHTRTAFSPLSANPTQARGAGFTVPPPGLGAAIPSRQASFDALLPSHDNIQPQKFDKQKLAAEPDTVIEKLLTDSAHASDNDASAFPKITITQHTTEHINSDAPGSLSTEQSMCKRQPFNEKRAVRRSLMGALIDREESRRKLVGTFTLESAQLLAETTAKYNELREKLASLMKSGHLEEEDAEVFPELLPTDNKPLKRKPEGLRDILNQRRQDAKEARDNPSSSECEDEGPTQEQILKSLKDKATSAHGLLADAKETAGKKPSKGRKSLVWEKECKDKIAKATRFYRGRRETLERALPEGWTAELLKEFPAIDEKK